MADILVDRLLSVSIITGRSSYLSHSFIQPGIVMILFYISNQITLHAQGSEKVGVFYVKLCHSCCSLMIEAAICIDGDNYHIVLQWRWWAGGSEGCPSRGSSGSRQAPACLRRLNLNKDEWMSWSERNVNSLIFEARLSNGLFHATIK